MNSDQFCELVKSLTGTPLKGITNSDRDSLSRILADDDRELDCSQLNELLLLVNKDRIQRPFFVKFFGTKCRIGSLSEAVNNFKITAMLAFGNFVYAYRVLSKLKTSPEVECVLGDLCIGGDHAGTCLANRPKKLLDIDPIPRDDTPLIGYLSAAIVPEAERSRLILGCLRKLGESATWEQLSLLLTEATNPEEQPIVLATAEKLQGGFGLKY